MTDYRALLLELVETWDSFSYADAGDATDRMNEAVEEARAALDEPEPVWPTDEDLVELACAEVYNSRNWEEPECTTDDPYPYEASSFAWLNFARAVLARWRQPVPQPMPEELTNQEIEEWAAASSVPREFLDPDSGRWERCLSSEEFCATVRAALAFWGQP
jgi:hypothetical protein